MKIMYLNILYTVKFLQFHIRLTVVYTLGKFMNISHDLAQVKCAALYFSFIAYKIAILHLFA